MSRTKYTLFGTVAVAMAALGIGVAAAQTGSGSGSDTGLTTTTTAAPKANGAAPDAAPKTADGRPGRAGRHGGPGGFGGPGIHGEFTVPDGNGGYKTIASQVGEVVSVSSTSIELKSEDGFTKKYVVDENTLVNAGRDGIANVKTGDKVAVQAQVDGSTAKAMHVRDATNIKSLREKWGFKKPGN